MKNSSIISRKISIDSLKNNSFLLGPRKVGKSTYLRNNFQKSLYIDLLDSSLYYDFLNNPSHFRESIKYELAKNSEYINHHHNHR